MSQFLVQMGEEDLKKKKSYIFFIYILSITLTQQNWKAGNIPTYSNIQSKTNGMILMIWMQNDQMSTNI